MAKNFDQGAYIAAYNKENYARIELKVSKGKKARWELQAKAAGQSLTAWLSDRADERLNGWAYTLIKGSIEETFDSAADYHFRAFGCRTPAEMVAAIGRVKASDPEYYIEEDGGADTIENFVKRFKGGDRDDPKV